MWVRTWSGSQCLAILWKDYYNSHSWKWNSKKRKWRSFFPRVLGGKHFNAACFFFEYKILLIHTQNRVIKTCKNWNAPLKDYKVRVFLRKPLWHFALKNGENLDCTYSFYLAFLPFSAQLSGKGCVEIAGATVTMNQLVCRIIVEDARCYINSELSNSFSCLICFEILLRTIPE